MSAKPHNSNKLAACDNATIATLPEGATPDVSTAETLAASAPAEVSFAETIAAPIVPGDIAVAETISAPLSPHSAGDAVAPTLPGPTSTPSSTPALVLQPDDERYTIAGEVARGGLGRILEATDHRLRRQVALKELLVASDDLEARFLREALITAKLQHPSIIPLHDAGRWKDGKPFYSMKLVSGSSLEAAIEAKQTLAERLSLLPHVIDVAEAIAYAHSRRIIHRDLKPQNVLVGSFGETVVIDWGIAKDLNAKGAASKRNSGLTILGDGASELTLDGTVIGTPAYMPTEQARGESVDERADVYALGAILYHLLAGSPPYDYAPVRDILKNLLSKPPKLPIPIRERLPGVPKDLEAIVDKAMAPAPEMRYPSAKELASDLTRFQTGQIVGAYHYSRRELFARWIRRNRWIAALTGMLLVVAAISVQQIVEKGRISEQGRRVAEAERAKAERAREKAAQAEARERARADEVTLQQARLSLDIDPEKSLSFLAQLSPNFPRFSAARVIAADALSHTLPKTMRGHTGKLSELVISPDGKYIASASYDKTIRLWDVATGKNEVLRGHTGEVVVARFSPDGKRLASVSFDKTARLWDLSTKQSTVLKGHTEWLSAVAFSPDGRYLASGGFDRKIMLWDTSVDGVPMLRVLEGLPEQPMSIAFSSDGAEIVAVDIDGSAHAWDATTGEGQAFGSAKDADCIELSPRGEKVIVTTGKGGARVLDRQANQVHELEKYRGAIEKGAFSEDQEWVAGARDDHAIGIWNASTGKLHRVLRGHQSMVTSLAFSRSGTQLVSGSADRTVRLWDLSTGDEQVLHAHENRVNQVVMSPDERWIASIGTDGTFRIWTLLQDHGALAGHTQLVTDVLFAKGGKQIISASVDATVRLWDVETKQSQVLEGHQAALHRIALSTDGKLLASGDHVGTIRLWDVESHPARLYSVLEGHTDEVRDLAFSPDGKSLASASFDKTMRVWNIEDPKRVTSRTLEGHEGPVFRAVFSPNGQLLASSGMDKSVRLWTLGAGNARLFSGHDSLVLGLTFSPDGTKLASASLDRTARIWDITTGESRVLASSEGGIYRAEFSSSGDWVVTSSDAGMIRIWNLETLENRALAGHETSVTSIELSPDGRMLASASLDGTVRLWDIATGEHRLLRGHHGNARKVVFSPDSKRLASAGDDGTVRIWSDDLPHDVHMLRERIQALGGMRSAPSP